MDKSRFAVLFTILLLGWLGGPDYLVFGAAEKSKHETRQPTAQPIAPDKQASVKQAKGRVKMPVGKERKQEVASEPQNKKSTDRVIRHTRRKKTGKAVRPPAIVQPKRDLSYHGLLEQPHRYDPSPEHRKGAAPNPQASELLHDHFQELDKNHDGMLDPFERALGRLDIDRDLGNRQWD